MAPAFGDLRPITDDVNISDYLRTALLNHAVAVATYVPPPVVWAGLYTTLPPTSAGGGVEMTATDYVRVATSWSLATLGQTSNAAIVNFPASGVTLSNWGTASGLGLFDAPTNGNLLFYGSISAPVQLSLGTSFEIAASGLVLRLS